jgi:hypothetical protein
VTQNPFYDKFTPLQSEARRVFNPKKSHEKEFWKISALLVRHKVNDGGGWATVQLTNYLFRCGRAGE